MANIRCDIKEAQILHQSNSVRSFPRAIGSS